MASRVVKKIKRSKVKESSQVGLPAIVVTPPVPGLANMKVTSSSATSKATNIQTNKPATTEPNITDFNITSLIAELSKNSRASQSEIENIQRRLLQQANEILKVNTFVNQTEPRVVDVTQKQNPNMPIYGRIPVVVSRNETVLANPAQQDRSLGFSRQNLGAKPAACSDNQFDETQLVPERLHDPSRHPVNNASAKINVDQGNMQRVAMAALDAARGGFFSGTGSTIAAPASARDASNRGELVPPYRMPPAPDALPGAPAPSALHTHSAKFPIEREVILSSGDKSSKVPILQEVRKQQRGRLGAVAPDTPPKALAAWTHAENQAGPSDNYRQQYHEPNYGYGLNQGQGAVPRNSQYESTKPPVPAKNHVKSDMQNNSQQITVTVETTKDSTRDAPRSSKSVSKTYHTLKDIISSKFKSKENVETEKNNEPEVSLNNSEERKRAEPTRDEQVTPRDQGVRKVEHGIYARPSPQVRADIQYANGMPNNMAYPSPSPHRQTMQQQIVQQQMLLNHHARSQEMLAASPYARPQGQTLGADALYQQYGPPGRRSAVYQREIDARSMTNFTSLKTSPQTQQYDHAHSRADLRSPQQLEREVVRHRGFIDGRRASSHPHLLDEPQHRPEVVTPHMHDRSRRNSHANILDSIQSENHQKSHFEERESDDGGFRRRQGPSRPNYEERIRTSGRSVDSQGTQDNCRRTPDSHVDSRRTPDSVSRRRKDEASTSGLAVEKNDESTSQKSVDSVYNSSTKAEIYQPQPSSSRQTPNRIEDLKANGKKGAGSGASSDYDKNGGQSSNVDSGRGSAAYSSGRRPDTLHDTSADSDVQPAASQQAPPGTENDWADLVECELRQILEPKLSSMRLDSSGSSDSSVTPPLPPISPCSDTRKRNSLPGRSEFADDRRRGRESPRWHKKHSSKREHHYKKQLFGLDTTDITSTTTRSLDLSSLLDGRTDSEASTGDARAIRRQLRGLENMYAEVLQLLGVRKPASLKQNTWESRLSSKRRYGSMSSLPSSSVSSRPVREKRRSTHEHRKKHDMKGINKRFQRLESHVVTLARSVAHLSSEMRTQHLLLHEVDNIRAEVAALRHMYKSQQFIRSGPRHHEPSAFSNPERVKRLTKFFGDEPPLMRLFLKRLGYEKYAALLEKEKVGAAELPYVGEDKLRALGVPLGPRMRILKEAGIHQDLHVRDDPHNTTTTLAIV